MSVTNQEWDTVYDLALAIKNAEMGAKFEIYRRELRELMDRACLNMPVEDFFYLVRAWHLTAIEMRYSLKTNTFSMKKVEFIPTEEEEVGAITNPDHVLRFGRGSRD